MFSLQGKVFKFGAFQIANYGLGGQYSTHHDSNGYYEGLVTTTSANQYRHNQAVGDRFVTVMGYLSEVELGGTTVFPLIGVRSPVEKGAIVLWFNLMDNGIRDGWGYHGGCPVAVSAEAQYFLQNTVNFLNSNLFLFRLAPSGSRTSGCFTTTSFCLTRAACTPRRRGGG